MRYTLFLFVVCKVHVAVPDYCLTDETSVERVFLILFSVLEVLRPGTITVPSRNDGWSICSA